MIYDVAVVGLGGIGSAILAHCAGRGAAVIGLEQFGATHDLGASSGKSRLIRQTYFEDPEYVPLVRRAYDLWRELERESGEKLLTITGLISVGEEGSEIIEGTLRAAQLHDLVIEKLREPEVAARFPALRMLPNELALFEAEGGVLKPEAAIRAHLRSARSAGAEMRFDVAMQSWSKDGDHFEVQLADGSKILARKLVLSLGPWFKETLAAFGVTMRVQRNVQCWFTPATNAYAAPGFPAYLVNRRGLPAPLYGFPDFGDGVKAAFHGWGELTNAQHLERNADTKRDVEPLARAMEDWMPGAAHALRETKVCMYSLTPDENFIVDIHPEHPGLILCGGFSGHGFKFAPVLGEIAADLVFESGTSHDIAFLSMKRFQAE